MSTRVVPEEYRTLEVVPRELTYLGRKLCDVEPSHGYAVVMLQTPDRRAIEPYNKCYNEILKIQHNLRKRNEL